MAKLIKRSLVVRLRAPIDSRNSVIEPMNDVSNIGLRLLADKLDAVGEALAYLIEKKKLKRSTKKSGKKKRKVN